MDIDIDIGPDCDAKKLFPESIRASLIENGVLKPHQWGLYFQKVPEDVVTGYCAVPFRDAEANGLFKFDMITVNLLGDFDVLKDKKELRKLTKIPPDWSLMEDSSIVSGLFHLGNHTGLITKVKPKSVRELADCLSLIRPNKRHLVDKYIADRNDPETLAALYERQDKSDFRRSHAIPYALLIVVQLHLIKASL